MRNLPDMEGEGCHSLIKEAEESGRPVEEIRCDGYKSGDIIF